MSLYALYGSKKSVLLVLLILILALDLELKMLALEN